MITDLDILRSARVLIDRHGEDAPILAAMESDRWLDEGNLDGARLWRAIVRAITTIQETRAA